MYWSYTCLKGENDLLLLPGNSKATCHTNLLISFLVLLLVFGLSETFS